ncbi:MAG: PEP-CTERM sorting domain-containing protein, partial [Verrucomicrobiota bacterium]
SISGLAGGTTNNSTLLLGITADTSTSGNKTGGTVTVALTSNGTGTSGLGNTVISPQDILVSGVVYDYAKPVYSKDSGAGTFTGSNATYTMDFGTGLSLSSIYTATIRLTNQQISLFQDSLGGSYTALSGASEISTNLGTLPVSIGTLAPTDHNTFTISFNAGTAGTFNGSLTFHGISEQAGLADASLPGGDITINILGATTAAVPEPSAWAAMFVGVSTFLLLRRRRKA